MFQNTIYLILTFVGITFSNNQALATSCRVYPSEYAYRDDSVTRTESANANCRRYPPRDGDMGIVYIHCDGSQLKLSDSDRGSNTEYTATSYYVWTTGSAEELLFIFPTRVSLTTITLHYYSDSDQTRSRLRFYAVSDDFDVWIALPSGTPYVGIAAVPPGGEPAGRRSVMISVNGNFNTKKVLMYKSSSSFQLAISEVEFLSTCTISNSTMTEIPPTSTSLSTDTTAFMLINNTTRPLKTMSTTPSFTTDTNTSIDKSNRSIEIIATVVSMPILLIILTITVVALIWSYKRRSVKHKLNIDDTYSTLNKGSRQTRQQTTQQHSAELYDQIHLSPSTGQTEFISKPQSENTNNPHYNSHPTHPDTEISGNNATAASQTNSSMATYAAAIDKGNKKKAKKEDDTKQTAAEKYTKYQKVSSIRGAHAGNSTKRSQISLEYNMCASDHQDKERVNSDQPSHSIEELYTAVKKKPKGSSSVPVNESVPQMAEDLYTAVMKKTKEKSVNDEVAPPIPPHTVEELYTAVHKKPAGSSTNTSTRCGRYLNT